MFRILKEENNQPLEVLYTATNEENILDLLVDVSLSHATNANDYTNEDISHIKEQQKTVIGSTTYSVDNVSPMTDEEIVACGGGVCKHCHSSTDVDIGTPTMEDGYITRILTCEICDGETIEVYSLTGSEK